MLYIVLNNDSLQLNFFLSKILNKSISLKSEIIKYNLKDTHFSDIYPNFFTISFLSQKRIFIIKNFDLAPKMIPSLEKINDIENDVILITSSTNTIKKIENTNLINSQNIFSISKTDNTFLTSFLQNYANQNNFKINLKAITFILKNSINISPSFLINQINEWTKLTKVIDLAFVQNNLKTKNNVFLLIERILLDSPLDFMKTYKIIVNNSFFDWEKLFNFMYLHLSKIRKIQILKKENMDQNQICTLLKINIYHYFNLQKYFFLFNLNKINKIITLICEYNYIIKKNVLLFNREIYINLLLNIILITNQVGE